MKHKKMRIILGLLVMIVLLFAAKRQYNRFLWNKAITTAEHKLQLGSFIFGKRSEPNGSQWYSTHYYIYKVVRIQGDVVRLASVNQLDISENLMENHDLPPAEEYSQIKENIGHTVVTGISAGDVYEGPSVFLLTKDLKEKYPGLNQSRYYYKTLIEEERNRLMPKGKMSKVGAWLGFNSSAEQIIKNGRLVPYTVTDNDGNYIDALRLDYDYAMDIDLIFNQKTK